MSASNLFEVDLFRLNALALKHESDCDLMIDEIEAALVSARRRLANCDDDDLSERLRNTIDSLSIKLGSVVRRKATLKGRMEQFFEKRFFQTAKAMLPEDKFKELVALANGIAGVA